MSILITILRIRLQKNPVNKVVLAIYSANEQIISEPSLPSAEPLVNLSFLISKQIKVISFAIQEIIANGKYFIIGKVDLYLYNIEQIKQSQKELKIFQLDKIAQTKNISDLAMFAGSVTFQISHSSRRKILTEIERVQIIKQTQQQQEYQAQTKIQPYFQEISMIPNQIQQMEVKQENVLPLNLSKNNNEMYQVDKEGYIVMKPFKAELQLQQIFSQFSQKPIKLPEQQKLKLSIEQKKEFIEIDPMKLKQSAVVKHYRMKEQKINKKPPIFEQINHRQRDHIGVNPSSNMFQVYTMCCGQQIDKSHQIEEYY